MLWLYLVGCPRPLPVDTSETAASTPLVTSADTDTDTDTDTDADADADTDTDADADTTLGPTTGFMRIEAGTYLIGCTDAQQDWLREQGAVCSDADVAHEATLTHPYEVSVTEVTVEDAATALGLLTIEIANGDDCAYAWGEDRYDCPAAFLTWHQAAQAANAYSRAAALTECYACDADTCERAYAAPADCPGYRLPTEAEWEVAARCGTDHVFAGDDDPAAVARTAENADGVAYWPVAGLAANDCGLFDLSGGVAEWVEDGWSSFTADPQVDPIAPTTGIRVIRGGDTQHDVAYARVASRDAEEPTSALTYVGFRLARTLPE
jgi:formylglycine-generating enzyme required for sulfatase activity